MWNIYAWTNIGISFVTNVIAQNNDMNLLKFVYET